MEEESFERKVGHYTFKIRLNKQEIQLVGRTPNVSFCLVGKETNETLPEKLRLLAQSIQCVFQMIKESAPQHLKYSQSELKFGVTVGNNFKIFGIPLKIKQLSQFNQISEKKDENILRQQLEQCKKKLSIQMQKNSEQSKTNDQLVQSLMAQLQTEKQKSALLEVQNKQLKFILMKNNESIVVPESGMVGKPDQDIVVIIKTIEGPRYSINMKRNQSIQVLKEQLSKVTQNFSNIQNVKLIFKNRVQNNQKILSEIQFDPKSDFLVAIKKN